MMLPQRLESLTPGALNLAGQTILGTQVPVAVNRTWPVEEFLIIVTATVNATGLTLTTGTTGQPGVDNILNIVKNVELDINDGVQPRTVINASGIALLEYAAQTGLNLDRATLASIALSASGTVAANMTFRITYRIPVVHPAIAEPLRTRMLMPCHTWAQDMNLKITFESAANMYSAGALSAIAVEVVLVRRQMDATTTAAIVKSGGFIPFDLLETPYNIAVGTSGAQRFKINAPGSYAGLLLRSYLGGATMTRNVLDQVTTPGSETVWDIESGGVTFRQWRSKTIQIINDLSRPANGVNQTYSPEISGAVAANTSYQPASSVYLDFLGDGLGSDSANELGSILDVNLPVQSGLLMEIVGNVANVATQGSQLYVLGHRWYGDLSKWQAIQT